MYTLLRIVQKLIGALNSDGTPAQVGAGIAVGAIFGLTPILNLHNLLALSLVLLFRVSLPAVTLGWLVTIPLGFALDPVFDAFGQAVLDLPALESLWRTVTNTPILALTNLNNSVVLGSLLVWILAVGPLYVVARRGVGLYRRTIYARFQRTKMYKAVRASKVYNMYRLFRPQ